MIKKCKHFNIKELVSRPVYEKYGDRAWIFIDDDIKDFLDTVREHFNRPITVNNWGFGGDLQQRGLRANTDSLVKDKTLKNQIYLSAHNLGRAIDFNVKGLTPKQVYNDILKNENKFKMIKRIEHIDSTPTWVHVDTIEHNDNGIYIFKP